jgi:hypothetical protein
MDRRLIFRHPLSKGEQIGDAAITWIGVIDASVPQGRQHSIWKSKNLAATKSQSGTMRTARTAIRHRCARRASEGVRENPREGTRQNDPVPSVQGVLPRKGEPQRIGSSDCLSKTQDSANSQEDV